MANTALLRSHELWKPASTLPLTEAEPRFPGLEIPALKLLFPKGFFKGLPRGGITEMEGARSSGRMSLCLHILAQATARGEICAVIDTQDSFHPMSARRAGVKLEHLVWVRCRGNAEHAMRAADLFLHAGGFGVVMLDLCGTSARTFNRIPLSYWYRFRRAVEHTPTIVVICAEGPQARSCSAMQIELTSKAFHWAGKAPFLLLRGLHARAVLRKRSAVEAQSLSIPSVA